MTTRGSHLIGVSRRTSLPRFVIRINADGKTYHYFRHGPHRERLPDPSALEFPGSYAEALVRHGLAQGRNGGEPSRSAKSSEVYFIQDGHTGAIKIGTALYPAQRLKELQVGTCAPLALLAAVPGGRALEKELHRRLASYRIRGEWFLNSPEVAEAVRELRSTLPRSRRKR